MQELAVESEEDGPLTNNDKNCQTKLTSEDISQLCLKRDEYNYIERKLQIFEITEHYLKNDDAKTRYFTGLDSFSKFQILFKFISPYISVQTKVTAFQQLLLTLMKLRLNLDFKDLAYRFNIDPTTASNYFKNLICILHSRLHKLIIWPDQETLKKTMPSCFKESFSGKSVFIIDCFELFIQKPADMGTAAQCWSHYKHHYTIKYLIAITPQGTVAFISEGWGGRTSDKHLSCNSSFFNKILPQDVILADRGFLITDYARMYHAKVVIPAFTKGKSQLHPTEIEETRAIAHVRIHVERIIGAVRQKFRIITDPAPISLLSAADGLLLDKIVVVCCALLNICPPIVPM